MTRAALRSFDIFDTLVARRCVDPHNVFRIIEGRTGQPGFADMRVKAEAALHAKGDYDLDAIYRAMAEGYGLSQAAAEHLKARELEVEFENLIPIREHIVEVEPGDLLISDMYLPRRFIERVARERCGLHFNPIYLSSHGKSGGRAWREITARFEVTLHTGDNRHSDIEMCARHGVKARHTQVAQASRIEIQIADLGYRELAFSLRAARLALWSDEADKLALGRAQIAVNFPVVFLSVLILIELAVRKGWRRLLFSSRDCFMMFQLAERLIGRMGLDLRCSYFFTSRLARVDPSADYLRYFESLCVEGEPVVVDICGTGWSLTRLFEAAGRPDTEIFFINLVVNPKLAEAYRSIGGTQRDPRVNVLTQGGHSSALEAFNATDHRMVASVVEVDGVFVPVFADLRTPPRYDEMVRFSAHAFGLALEASDQIPVDELFRWLTLAKPAHVGALYQQMQGLAAAAAPIFNQQSAENGPVTSLLFAKAQSKPAAAAASEA